MGVAESVRAGLGPVGGFPSLPGALLEVLNLAAVVLDEDGKIAWWSPQARQLFGYTEDEALGRSARRLLVDEKHLGQVTGVFARVKAQEGAAGVFPARHKDGSTRLMECHSVRLQGERGGQCLLGVITEHEVLQRVQRDLALSAQLISQSPIGLAVLDADLRYIVVNPALERINGVPARDHVGRTVRQVLTFLDVDPIESAMRQVLTTGTPVLAQVIVTPTPSDPGRDHSWSVSYYRMEDAAGRVLGLAVSLVDITEQHLAATEAIAARQRLARIADASARIGTTLDLDTTAGELVEMCVPSLADLAAVDVLDAVLEGERPDMALSGPGVLFRALSVAAAYPTPATGAADRAGEIARYGPDRLVTQCAVSGRPLLVPHVDSTNLARIAADQDAATVLARAGVHSYLAVPMTVRGRVLGVLDLARARNPVPFDGDDVLLAVELAARAAVCIDHALWYQQQRQTAETLQRSLLPLRPPHRPGLEIACRYQAAGAACEVGGDWYDVVPLPGGKTALVIGDVMGSGINAAATMGQLRTATRTLATLDLDPAAVLQHLDHITADLNHRFATCIYAVHDPHRSSCRLSSAGHLPPVLVRPDRGTSTLLNLPTGAPLGVGGVPFKSTCVALSPSDRLALYTDGLVEVRDQALDTRLETLLDLLAGPQPPLEDTCDLLLNALRHPEAHDDVALLMARARHTSRR
ncbi:SpoIIE family protein phosphatase [Streptomyces sp. NPDC091412]|uniref:SpoIIE family protein phosphatase n=1 Tax=Streptomyces sp. NPDC091412 TaxID=3366002 RepID=UPI003801ED9D